MRSLPGSSLSFLQVGSKPVFFLIFSSVNFTNQLVGVAKMNSNLKEENYPLWWDNSIDKWNQQFALHWLYIKDIENRKLYHLKDKEGKAFVK